jgi:thiol-disulfide isomerase/thioredoxin
MVVCGLLATACGLVLAGCSGGSSGGDTPGLAVFAVGQRQPAPALSGATLDGGTLSLRSVVAGARVVVVNVWASWCGPCRAELPALAHAATRLRRSGVRFVGIDEQDDNAKALAFAHRVGTTYPSLVDRTGALLHQLSVLPSTAVPSTLFIDGNGRMAARVIGPVSASELASVVARVRGTT